MGNGYPHSTIAQILEDIISQINFNGSSHSNIADILLSILNQTPYDEEPRSVLAELFLKLKAKIEGEPFDPYDKETHSVIADILISILNETEYTDVPQSRIAELLLELKEELESYTEITVSGSIVSFTTNVAKPLVKLETNIVAIQSGSGDPYPAGGGANIWGGDGMLQDFINANISDFSYDTTAKTLTYGAPQIASKTIKIFANAKENTAYTLILSAKNTANTTHTNLIVYYTDGTYAPMTAPTSLSTKQTFAYVTNASKTLESVRGGNYNGRATIYYDECCVLEGVKTVSDFVPWENIRPISGWTEANLSRVGNLIDYDSCVAGYLSYTGVFTNPTSAKEFLSDYIEVTPSSTLNFTAYIDSTSEKWTAFAWYKEDKTFISRTGYNDTDKRYSRSVRVPNNAYYVRIMWRNYSDTISSVVAYNDSVGTTVTLQFGTTIYFGIIDWVSGVATVLGQKEDMGNLNYTKYDVAEGTLFRTQISGAKLEYNVDNLLCSAYHFTLKALRANGTYTIPDNMGNLDFINNSYSDATTFKTAMAGQELVYELTTPFDIQLTPTEIDALAGDNTIFADTGDVEVTYLYKGTPET